MVKQRPNWLNWRNGVSLGVGLVGLGIAIALATGKLKAGIGGGETVVTSEKTTVGGVETTTTTTPQEAKTLWDWLNLAGVVAIPVVLAGLGAQLQTQQQKRSEEQLQEEILQNYYDKVSALLVDKNLLAIAAKVAKAERDQDTEELFTDSATGYTATPEEKELLDVSVDVIRARTLTTLRRLDSTRKTSLIQFLLESEVISKLKLSLQNADLEGVILSDADLKGVDLRGVNLRGSDLYEVNLNRANLSRANLTGAYLMEVYLQGANLDSASLERARLWNANLARAKLVLADLERAILLSTDLEGANLVGAHMKGARLWNANLKEADLSQANLGGTKGLTKEQIEGENAPYLCRTQLPEGIDIDPNRDCESLKRVSPKPD